MDVSTPHVQVDLTGADMILKGVTVKWDGGGVANYLTSCGFDLLSENFYFDLPALANYGTSKITNIRRIYWNAEFVGYVSGALIANIYAECGLATENGTNVVTTNAIYLSVDGGGGANQYNLITNGGGSTSTNLTASIDFTVSPTIKMHWWLDGATPTVKLYVNGTLRATHTTNIPTVLLSPFCAAATNPAGAPGATRTFKFSGLKFTAGAAP
jgi:hypothetical protein